MTHKPTFKELQTRHAALVARIKQRGAGRVGCVDLRRLLRAVTNEMLKLELDGCHD